MKEDGAAYTVFTPYSIKWKSLFNNTAFERFHAEKFFHHLLPAEPFPIPQLSEIGFKVTDTPSTDVKIDTALIKDYHSTRDFPGIHGTSRLGVHLRFGTVSIREIVSLAMRYNQKFLNELIWREFYQQILWNFPHIGAGKAFKQSYDRIQWLNDEAGFEAWCEGRTGYPLVDAGMRELNATGFIHNRVRMVVASFLCKHLLIDWRWGEAYFAQKLLDYEFASNNGGWQWAAGSGCDAAPYFRIFNPTVQAKKFDPHLNYISKWIPELNSFDYPPPFIEHTFARQRALDVYSRAIRVPA
jgi:deoxyribodipyrimidine photo-lyase